MIITTLVPLLKHALSISFFVFVMMLLVEYLNVISRGKWEAYFCRQRGWMQYFWAAMLGILPGCLGAFAAATLYSHRLFSLGAIVATMVATSGDEAFVMFALFPGKAFQISALLFGFALISGWLVDRLFGTDMEQQSQDYCDKLVLHKSKPMSILPGWASYKTSWSESSRLILLTGLIVFIALLSTGMLGPQTWNWKRITFLIIGSLGMWIVSTSSHHFIKEHLWKHVTMEHLPALFGWIFLALIVIHFVTEYWDFKAVIEENTFQLTLISALVGIIPSSGPHLLFVTLYSKGLIPLSTLVVSSIVQDGHGMLPLLAFSRVTFLKVKAINFSIGILVGIIWLALAA
ncbi:MAG: arsenic efflux protein [Candidatus Marinimicrobia bacterium]|nr:arsenic efflux protein [Candidatus Neomarinimicrobiota bacterium]